MDIKEIEEKVKEIMADKLDIKREKITVDSSLANDLGVDSFGSIEIIFALEDAFNVKIPEDDLKHIEKVGDIVNYLTEKLNQGV